MNLDKLSNDQRNERLEQTIVWMKYCWWLKSCTTWDVLNPVNSRANCQPQLVSRISEPSTVVTNNHIVLNRNERTNSRFALTKQPCCGWPYRPGELWSNFTGKNSGVNNEPIFPKTWIKGILESFPYFFTTLSGDQHRRNLVAFYWIPSQNERRPLSYAERRRPGRWGMQFHWHRLNLGWKKRHQLEAFLSGHIYTPEHYHNMSPF